MARKTTPTTGTVALFELGWEDRDDDQGALFDLHDTVADDRTDTAATLTAAITTPAPAMPAASRLNLLSNILNRAAFLVDATLNPMPVGHLINAARYCGVTDGEIFADAVELAEKHGAGSDNARNSASRCADALRAAARTARRAALSI